MKKLTLTISATLLAGTAFAAGLDNSYQGIDVLFEEGNAFQLGFVYVNPDVSGEAPALAVFGLPTGSGSVSDSYSYATLGIKGDINSQFSLALIYDQPFFSQANYPADGFTGGVPGYDEGLNAELNSSALTAIGRYKLNDRFSIHAGLSYQVLNAELNTPVASNGVVYQLEADDTTGIGWLAGVAYEIPEYALRVDLTYRSAVDHTVDVTEQLYSPALGGAVPPAFGGIGVLASEIEVTTPESINLNFQTGINPQTLVFGGVRWANWKEFEISAPGYGATIGGGDPVIVDYEENVISYNLGVGRKINDQISVFGSLRYEGETDETPSLLSPTNGKTTLAIGGTYEIREGTKIRAGLAYTWLGDAEGVAFGPTTADFKDNSAVSVGLQLTQAF